MLTVARVLHALGLGIWAGTTFLFNGCVAIRLVWYFQRLSESPTPGMPPVDRVVSTRMFGDLISTIFPTYFAIQLIAGAIAGITGIYLASVTGVGKWRAIVVMVALLVVSVNVMALYRPSTALRQQQYAALDAGNQEEFESLRKRFFAYHGPSLALDFASTALVFISLGMLGTAIMTAPPAPAIQAAAKVDA